MFNNTWSAYNSTAAALKSAAHFLTFFLPRLRIDKPEWIFGAAVFLVSVPVFFEAPLVRHLPLVSLILTGGWLWLSFLLLSHRSTQVWGDLFMGFSGSWLAGSLYWGWFRWEPLLHLPIEAMLLPVALWCIYRRQWLVGSWFYLGSLFGTAVTDIYFYWVDLIPHWRQLMQVEPDLALPIFQSAIAQVRTPWGIGWALVLAIGLLTTGLVPLCLEQSKKTGKLHWWAFSGAVLSTILVDGLFLLAACLA